MVISPSPGDELTNKQLSDRFSVGNMGGMRRSLVNNCLVLISDPSKGLYEDEWRGDILHYTGMGQEGDQVLKGNQNRTLAESRSNGVKVYLLEAFEPQLYTFRGEVELAGQPYQAIQDDAKSRSRLVWMFPLRLRTSENVSNRLRELTERREEALRRKARKLSDTELATRVAQKATTLPLKQEASVEKFDRNPYVVEAALRSANGFCDLCGEAAPFKKKDLSPYLEVHHIVWLARGGFDDITNAVALCPNCHRRMHVLDEAADVERLQARVAVRCPL